MTVRIRRAQPARLLAAGSAGRAEKLFLLGRGTFIVGSRGDASLRIQAPDVAPRHAVIRYRRGRYLISGARSGGGTFVNGVPVIGTESLRHGDIVRFGTVVTYKFIDPDGALRLQRRRALRLGLAALPAAAIVVVYLRGWGGGAIGSRRDAVRVEAKPAPARPLPPAALQASPSAPSPLRASAGSETKVVARRTPEPVKSLWIQRLNHYRTMAGLDPVREDPHLSAAVDAHVRYLITNFAEHLSAPGSLGADVFTEDAFRPGYSPKGAEAAANSQIAWGCGMFDHAEQIDRWIAGPFHRIDMLDPDLKEAGFSEAQRSGCWIAALGLAAQSEGAAAYADAVRFPPNGSHVDINFAGGESPDPLAGCAGWAMPVGLPITLETGRLIETGMVSAELTRDGRAVESCAYDAESYRNPNEKAQEYGRWLLRSHGAVVVIPRKPLSRGADYTVSIAVRDKTYTWSFRAGGR